MADKEMSYDHLATGLKEALQNDKSAFDADRLQKYTGIYSNSLMHPIFFIPIFLLVKYSLYFCFAQYVTIL